MTAPTDESIAHPEKPASPSAPAAPHANRPVLIGSGLIIVALALWAIIAPVQAGEVIGSIVAWTSRSLGWYYIATAGIVMAFVVILALGRTGEVRLGPDHSRPQFSLFTWTAMLFAAGIGVDLMFFSVAEPVTQFTRRPAGPARTSRRPGRPSCGPCSTTAPSAGRCTP